MILLTIKCRLVKAAVIHIHKPRYLNSGVQCFSEICKRNPGPLFYFIFLLMFYTLLIPPGGADSRRPLQLTKALHEPSAVSKVQMESCQQRDSFRSAYCMIHPWQEDRPGGGPTTLTPIGEPGQDPRCPFLRSAGRDRVRKYHETTTCLGCKPS